MNMDTQIIDPKIVVPKRGYIYCTHNETYFYYGENVFKLGETGDLDKRLAGYSAYAFVPSVIKYSSDLLADSQLAEKILFHELKEYRMASNREYFNCNLQKIIDTIDYISDMFKSKSVEEIQDEYFGKSNPKKRVVHDNTIDSIVENIHTAPDDQKIKTFIESFGIDKQLVESDVIFNRIEKEIKETYGHMFACEDDIKSIMMYSNLKNRSFIERLGDDFVNKPKIFPDDYKISVLDDLHTLLGIEWFDRKLLDKLKLDGNLNRKIKIPDRLQDALINYNFLRYTGKIPTTYIDIVRVLLSKYVIFSNNVLIRNSKDNINNFSYMIGNKRKQKTLPILSEYVDMLDVVFEYEKQIKERKRELLNNINSGME